MLNEIITNLKKNSYIYYFIIVLCFVITKVKLGWSFADKDGDRDDKMPDGMKWVNVAFIGTFLLFNMAMIFANYNGNKSVVGFLIVTSLLIIGCIIIEIRGEPFMGLIKNSEHISYVPAIVTLLYVIGNIVTHSTYWCIKDNEHFIKLSAFPMVVVAFLSYVFSLQINSYRKTGQRIISINNERNLKVGDYAEKFTAYQTISTGEITVIEMIVPLIVATYLYNNTTKENNMGTKYNTFILSVISLGLLCSGVSRIIGNIVKRIIVKPRPCAARMAGCNLANNKVSCGENCEACNGVGNVKTVNCKKTCYYSDVDKKVLTPDCMCNGVWKDFTGDENSFTCPNLWRRKMQLYNYDAYLNDENKMNSVSEAFQSMPSSNVLSAWFVTFFVMAIFFVAKKRFNFNISYLIMMLIILCYSTLTTYLAVYEGWNWTQDCLIGIGIALICVIFIVVCGYNYISHYIE